MSNLRAHIFIEGFVQGVGFRWWCAEEAKELGLTGWVRNLADGRVEAVFQGDKVKVELMLEKCRKGPIFSKVSHIDISFEEANEGFQNFDIRPTE